MEIEIAALGDGRYQVMPQSETDGQVTLSSEAALKDYLRARGLSDARVGTIMEELQPAPRKIRLLVSP